MQINISFKWPKRSQCLYLKVCVFPPSDAGHDTCCILYGDTEVGILVHILSNYQRKSSIIYHLIIPGCSYFLCLCFRDV